jgi:hypothetical protein
MRAGENFGHTSVPRLPQAAQTKPGSISDKRRDEDVEDHALAGAPRPARLEIGDVFVGPRRMRFDGRRLLG